jgi:DNA-binding winged helix-turn-helix (wHTH) protein
MLETEARGRMSASAPLPANLVHVPGFVIDLAREELRTITGECVDLRPRSLAVLRLLAANLGHVVTKDELMSTVWNDAIVTEDSLTQCIADIRRVIGDTDRRMIRTVPRRGYMLSCEASPEPDTSAAEPSPVRRLGWKMPASAMAVCLAGGAADRVLACAPGEELGNAAEDAG